MTKYTTGIFQYLLFSQRFANILGENTENWGERNKKGGHEPLGN